MSGRKEGDGKTDLVRPYSNLDTASIEAWEIQRDQIEGKIQRLGVGEIRKRIRPKLCISAFILSTPSWNTQLLPFDIKNPFAQPLQ
jgi:hypothetical protein